MNFSLLKNFILKFGQNSQCFKIYEDSMKVWNVGADAKMSMFVNWIDNAMNKYR